MRIKVELNSNGFIHLKKGFLRTLQGLIYNLLDGPSAIWLHNEGFKYEKRKFKLFTFSSILEKGRLDKKNNMFSFPPKISFYISSPVNWILEQVAENFITGDEFFLGENKVFLNSIAVLPPKRFGPKIKIKSLNPIAMRSTGDDGKYKLCPPGDRFSESISKNLQKKWVALKKEECPYEIKIEPIQIKKAAIWYGNREKGAVIEGWKGVFELSGEPEFLKFAYDTGLGERNSMGFGMWEVIDRWMKRE